MTPEPIALLALSVLCGFVSWRIASLLHTEDIFEWLRHWIGIDNDEDGYPRFYPEKGLGKLFGCFWCLSTITALPITALLIWGAAIDWIWALLVWLSASTVAIWTEKQILRSQSR
jgi:hypothetical protein